MPTASELEQQFQAVLNACENDDFDRAGQLLSSHDQAVRAWLAQPHSDRSVLQRLLQLQAELKSRLQSQQQQAGEVLRAINQAKRGQTRYAEIGQQ